MLKVESISFGYSEEAFIKDISFEVDQGKQLAIIGESGSGKTTLLKLLYGEFDLFSGSIHWKNTQILGPSYNLIIGYDFMKVVSQEFDLMPFISVEESVGGYLSNFFPEEKKERTKELVEIVGLEKYATTRLDKLSGGQKQRVALARALAKEPEIILLDEPFSHIDSFKKQQLRRNLFRYLKRKNISSIVATHDKDDVLGFSDEVLVLDQGRIVARATAEELYTSPPNTAVASFFGEYNKFLPSELNLDYSTDKPIIIYATQLKISDSPEISVLVKYCQFNGANYLIEAEFKGRNVYFYSDTPLENGIMIGLSLKK